MDTITIDINEIISKESIVTHYQPIVSVYKRSVVGVEALTRGIIPAALGAPERAETLCPPNLLFQAASEQNMTVEFDRLCRKMALENYREAFRKRCLPPCQPLLFLNIDTTIIDQGVVGSGYLIDKVKVFGIEPKYIVLEILESKVKDTEALSRFVTTYKEHGFLIALDDVGAGYSNLDRIPMLKPDIIKIDRYLLQNLDKEFYKQEVFRSLTNLAKKLGALVVAEGVETLDEAITAVELGADFLQGYYVEMPKQITKGMFDHTHKQIDSIGEAFRKTTMKKLRSKRVEYETYDFICKQITDELETVQTEEFEEVLQNNRQTFSNVECLYILNSAGNQISSTVFATDRVGNQSGYVYQPAEIGADHSLKNYYLFVSTGQNKHITDSYVSLASGNLCVTVSTAFAGSNSEKYILCVDLYPQSYT